jgi:hypothetical protein
MLVPVKISGVIFLSAGFILAIKPDFFGKFSTSLDAYQMIEKRVKWGMLIGLGGFMIFYNNWTCWGLTATALLASLTFGVILARLTGMVLNGFLAKQLYWLLIELVALVIITLLYWKQTL